MNTVKVSPTELPAGARFTWDLKDTDTMRIVIAVKDGRVRYYLDQAGTCPFTSKFETLPMPCYLIVPSLYSKVRIEQAFRRKRLCKAFCTHYVRLCWRAKKWGLHKLADRYQDKTEMYQALLWQYDEAIECLLLDLVVDTVPVLPSPGPLVWIGSLVAPTGLKMAVIAFL